LRLYVEGFLITIRRITMRIGKFSGTIYDKDYDFSQCQECCTCISEEEAQDKSFLSELRQKNKIDCITCMGCPMAMSGN